MPTLRDSIHDLAQKFAAHIVDAIRSASLEDILSTSGATVKAKAKGSSRRSIVRSAPARHQARSSKRLARRSARDIAGVTERIVTLVKSKRGGLRAEQIRRELGIAKNEWMRPLELALSTKKLTKKGQKRATTYFAR
jgi:hypothetical protein